MKKIYDISKGQAITLWVFFVPIWLISIIRIIFWEGRNSLFVPVCLFWGIPFVLIFYTLGWKNNKNKQ